MKYLGIEPKRPRVAVFDFTGCEGCELQLANKEETLVPFLSSIEVASFREISSKDNGAYDIALVDGSISRGDEVERLKQIRERAGILVALGSCACFGGVSRLKNAFDLAEANREVYGEPPKATLPTRSIAEVVPVDLKIPGCPVSKEVPDFVDAPSVLPLLHTNPDVVHLAARLKGLANRLCDAVAGRTTHPVSLQVGGVAVMPERPAPLSLRDELKRSLEDLEKAIGLVRGFEIPDFARETEFVSLKGEADYPFIGGQMIPTDGVVHGEGDYLLMTNEYVDENNTSKWCRLSRESFAVGALARFNNNHRFLHPKAREVASQLGLEPVCHNPFMNNVAQLVECVHATHDAIRLIEELVEDGPAETMAPVRPKSGQGAGAVEVPPRDSLPPL